MELGYYSVSISMKASRRVPLISFSEFCVPVISRRLLSEALQVQSYISFRETMGLDHRQCFDTP